jgi:hypothetical protein
MWLWFSIPEACSNLSQNPCFIPNHSVGPTTTNIIIVVVVVVIIIIIII